MDNERKEIKINRIEELPQFARVFIEDVVNVKGQSINTAVGYCADLRGYFKYLNTEKHITEVDLNCMRNLTLMDLNEYLSYRTQDGVAKRTDNRTISTFRNFFRYLYKNKFIDENIAKDLEFAELNDEDRSIDYLQKEEVEKIFQWIYAERETLSESKLYNSKRNECILQVFIDCCLRISELANIKLSDIDITNRKLKVKGKGTKYRYVKFNRDTLNIINKWLKTRISNESSEDYLFTSTTGKNISTVAIRKMINDLSEATGIEFHPHALRHTGATLKNKNGLDAITLKNMLGHSSITTTQIYVHTDDEQLEKAARATPRFKRKI